MPVTCTCLQCGAQASPAAGQDVHDAVRCACCPQAHDHGIAASSCTGQHDGPCWTGPQAGPRPDGCLVCRPLLILLTATLAGGGS